MPIPAPLPQNFEEFRSLVLEPDNDGLLVEYLRVYAEDCAYTGAFFHDLSFAGPSHPDRIDIADVASLSLLSVTLNATMARQLIQRSTWTDELAKELALEPDRDLGDLTEAEAARLESDDGLNHAWHRISGIHGIGPTRTSKLLARKRPRLIPIWDRVIDRTLGLEGTMSYWNAFHTALTIEGRALDMRLAQLGELAGISDRFSRIRTLDILAWMHGRSRQGYEDEILTELDSERELDRAP